MKRPLGYWIYLIVSIVIVIIAVVLMFFGKTPHWIFSDNWKHEIRFHNNKKDISNAQKHLKCPQIL